MFDLVSAQQNVSELTDFQTAGVLAAIFAFIVLYLVFVIAWYVYTSFAYMAIAKKAKQSSPGLAWIPGVGPLIIAFRASKMHWWPWFLLLGYAFLAVPPIAFAAIIAFYVFVIIWHWKLFEKIGRPGWWALLLLIPLVNLVMIGIAAWGNASKRN